jgi:nucleotide-binding universal stress UspA family protein
MKPIKSILFATDLTDNCKPALDFTMVLATRFQATIYMLHVIEKIPDRVRDLVGTHEWESLVGEHRKSVHKSLLGKRPTSMDIRENINDFCRLENIDQISCNFKSSEIIITDGVLVDDILENAEKNECDLIVMGCHRGVFGKSSIGNTIKDVMKNTKIAVTVVPSCNAVTL